MWISKLTVQNCRIITEAQLELSTGTNILVGHNASGKSSLLEALCLLARGRSFRTPRINEVIHNQATEITVSAKLSTENGTVYPIGIRKTAHDTFIRINHADIPQQAELSLHLPLTLIHPGSIELLTGGPQIRRAFIDWIAFYLFSDFHSAWRQYQRVLKQRNACLRDPKQRFLLNHWTEQLITWIPVLHHYRSLALQSLEQALTTYMPLLTQQSYPQLRLSSGFPQEIAVDNADALLSFFHSKREMELKQGFTLYGTHRADLTIMLQNVVAVRIASRGQLKLLAVGLLLARTQAIQTSNNPELTRSVLAIDDLAAELDEQNQQALYNTLQQTRQQLILTSTRQDTLPTIFPEAKMFHVKHGVIQSM